MGHGTVFHSTAAPVTHAVKNPAWYSGRSNPTGVDDTAAACSVTGTYNVIIDSQNNTYKTNTKKVLTSECSSFSSAHLGYWLLLQFPFMSCELLPPLHLLLLKKETHPRCCFFFFWFSFFKASSHSHCLKMWPWCRCCCFSAEMKNWKDIKKNRKSYSNSNSD